MATMKNTVAAALVLLYCSSAAAQVNPYADCCDSYCFREDENPYLYLGTKTAYLFVYGKSSNQHIVPHCTPVQFWSFNRHGVRLPNKKVITDLEKLQKIKEEIIRNYDSRGSYPETGRLCEKDLDLLRRWTWNFTITPNNAELLTEQGKDDMRYLARRYHSRYPELLSSPYTDHNFRFQYTETERTRASFEAYAEGLFGSDAYKVHGISKLNDTVTYAYKYCKSYKEHSNNPETLSEQVKFTERDEYKRLIAHVSRRLGFRYTLDEATVYSMYEMCRFEKAWYVNRNSPWCAAFTKEQLRLLEYSEDLKYYYVSGYGSQINLHLGCETMKDMLDRFTRIVNGDMSEPKAVVYFSHSAALQLLLVSLGINKDNLPLTADNMHAQARRLWRTSLINPFSANLVSVLYRCTQEEKYRVMFFLNERPVDYPGCSVGLCSWDFIKQQLAENAERCNLDFCNRSGSVSITNSIIVLFLSVLFTYILNP